jgi:hypothetical protein
MGGRFTQHYSWQFPNLRIESASFAKFATMLIAAILIFEGACGASCSQCEVNCNSQADECQTDCPQGAPNSGKCFDACGVRNKICSNKCDKLFDLDTGPKT